MARNIFDTIDENLPEVRDCPQCGEPSTAFSEGQCVDCTKANQDALDAHNASFDQWENMTPAEREDRIRWAMNHG